jgi:hypothetical protein
MTKMVNVNDLDLQHPRQQRKQKSHERCSRPEPLGLRFPSLNLHRSLPLIQARFRFHGRQLGRICDSDAAGCLHSHGRTTDPRLAALEARAEDQDRRPDRRPPTPTDGEGFLLSGSRRSRWHGECRRPAGCV